MSRKNKNNNNQPSPDPPSEGAAGGGAEVLPKKLGHGNPKGKVSFADLQEQSTLHLEVDVRSNGMLKSWKRKTILVCKDALYICKNKSNGWSEKKVLLGMQSEVRLMAPDKKNVNRHHLILTGSDRKELKVGLDSENDQGALAKALEGEGATITGMDSITIFKTFLSNRPSHNRSAPGNIGHTGVGEDPIEPDKSLAAAQPNFYGSLNHILNDLTDGKTVNDDLATDDSFLTNLEVDEAGSSREVSSNEPLYKNLEVKLYKQNLRSKDESELYDKLDHGYGKPKNVIMQATSHHRPAPAEKQNIVLNPQQPSSVTESKHEFSDEEEIYETTVQVGQEVSRLNSTSNYTSSSSQRPESSQTCSSEDNLTAHHNDIPSLSSNDEQAAKNIAVLQSVEEAEIVCYETTDKSGPTLESFKGEKNNEGATHQLEVKPESQVETHEPNANSGKTDQPVTTLESQGEAHDETGQPKTNFVTLGKEHKQISVGNVFDSQIYGTIDRETYGALYKNASETNNSSTGILEDRAIKLTDDAGVEIYGNIWEISGISEDTTLAKAESDNDRVTKLIAEKHPNDDDCKDGERSSTEHTKIKSDISVETEFSSKNKSLLNLEDIPDQIELDGIINEENRDELHESTLTSSSDPLEKEHDVNSMQEVESTPPEAVSLTNYANSDQEKPADDQNFTANSKEINNFKQLLDCDNRESNGSQSTLSLKNDELLNTFVEKVTQTYGPDHEVKSNTNNSSDKTSELIGSGSSPAVDVGHDIYEDNLLGFKNNINGKVQAEDGLNENSNDDCEGYQEEDKNECDQPDDRHNKHIATNHNGSPEGDISSQSTGKKDTDKEYDLSELLGAITNNSTELNTNNNLEPMTNFDYPNELSTQNGPSVGVSFVGLYKGTAERASETDIDMKRKIKSLRIETEQIGNEAAVKDESHDLLSEEQGNDESVDQDIEEDAEGPGNLFYNASTFPNNVIFTSHDEEIYDSNGQNNTEMTFEKFSKENDNTSCLADRKSSKKTKKKVRFSDDIQEQCLEIPDDDSENGSVFSECEDNSASETNFSNENSPNDYSIALEENFEKQKSNSDVEQDLNESTGPSTIEVTKSTSNSKSVKNSSVMNSDASSLNRRLLNSRLQQPKKVVLPALGDGDGRGNTMSTSAIVLEPNAGTCLVDYSRGGRMYQTRILKVEDGCLHIFSSPPSRRGSYPEHGVDGKPENSTARPIHSVELGKSSVVPGLKADGEGMFSITLTLSGGKTVHLKSPNRDEQMRLVFLLSDEVMRVTPPEDRVGLRLYPSKVKEPNNKSEDTTQLSTPHKVQLTASPIVSSNLGTSPPSSSPPRLPKSIQNESTQPINNDPLTKPYKNEADREPGAKVSADAKYLSDSKKSSDKELLWQNILKNRTNNFGPEGFANKAVAERTILTPLPPSQHSPEECIFQSTISSSGSTKDNDKTLVSRTPLMAVPDGVNRVKPNSVSNKISSPKKQTDDHISPLHSKLPTTSQSSNKWMPKKYLETPAAGTVSKLRSIFEFEYINSHGSNSSTEFGDDYRKTHHSTNQNKRRSRSRSLNDDQASVPGEVLGAYARPPSIVIKELNDDPSQAEEDGAVHSVRDWWTSGTGRLRRDSFGGAHQAELGTVRILATSVNYSAMTVEGVAEAINPVLQAKRQKMDSKMVVADIRSTRDQLANRALELWELAQQKDEEQQLE